MIYSRNLNVAKEAAKQIAENHITRFHSQMLYSFSLKISKNLGLRLLTGIKIDVSLKCLHMLDLQIMAPQLIS
jgi:hypothetical protein